MNTKVLSLAEMTRDEFAHLTPRQRKLLRKQVRGLIRADLQRRAITGEPSPFKRAPQ